MKCYTIVELSYIIHCLLKSHEAIVCYYPTLAVQPTVVNKEILTGKKEGEIDILYQQDFFTYIKKQIIMTEQTELVVNTWLLLPPANSKEGEGKKLYGTITLR